MSTMPYSIRTPDLLGLRFIISKKFRDY
jgi:hypothetical protein